MERQEQHYHKCHRCLFQGQSVEFTLPDMNGMTRNGEVPRPEPRDDQGAPLRTEQVVEIPARNGDVVVPAADGGTAAGKDASPVAGPRKSG